MTYLIAAVLATANAGETVVLDFYADWCGPCKMMDSTVGHLAAKGYPVRKVDIEKNPELAQRYRVRSIPCFVVVVDGKEKGREVGMASLEQLERLVNGAGIQPAGTAVVQHRGQSPDRSGPRLPWSRRQKKDTKPAVQVPLVQLGQPTSAPGNLVSVSSVGVNPPKTQLPPSSPPAVARVQPPAAIPPTGRPGAAKSDPLRRTSDEQLLAASVRLRVEEEGGYSFGSGTIIDFRPAPGGSGGVALVLTCGHVLREAARKDSVLVDVFHPRGSRSERGRIVDFDLHRDIGLITFQTNRPVTTIPLAAANVKIMPGDRIVSIGCDHGQPPTIQPSHVMAINSFVGPKNLQVAGQPAVGRSGGGLYNRDGHLVGVCNFADPTDRAGLYAAVELAHKVIEKSGWQFSGAPPAAELSSNTNLIARGQQSPADTEVICIVRRNGKEEVIVIKNASPNLLQQLNEARKVERGTFPTSMDTRRPVLTNSGGQRPATYTTTDWNANWR